MLNKQKTKSIAYPSFSKKSKDFQQLVNGVFQAEGCVSGRIRGKSVCAKLNIGQNLSLESLIFFVQL
jgi:hypothetical protein